MGPGGCFGGVQPSHRPKAGKHGRFSLLQPSHCRPRSVPSLSGDVRAWGALGSVERGECEVRRSKSAGRGLGCGPELPWAALDRWIEWISGLLGELPAFLDHRGMVWFGDIW